MALNKQSLPINFAQGLDTKTDPYQVAPGKFLSLQNTVFDKGGLLQKRNGYGKLTQLPDSTSQYVTTFNDNLIAIGQNLSAYSQGSNTWVNKATLQPLQVNTLPLVRSATNQIQVDTALAANGLVCTVYTEEVSGSPVYKYVIADSITGQNIVSPTVITPPTGAVAGSPRVFLLGNYFIIVFTNFLSPTYRLQYFSIATANPTQVGSFVTISSVYTPNSKVNFDGVIANNALYLAWNGSDGGGAVRMVRLDFTLTLSSPAIFPGRVATIMSVTADTTLTSPIIYASFYDSGTSNGYTLAINTAMVTVLAPTQTISGETVLNITSSAQSSVCTVIYEVSNNYGYDAAIPTHYTKQRTITQSGTLGTAAVVARSVGLASKSFISESNIYFLSVYSSNFQPSYFLLDIQGRVVSKLAYSNGYGYYVLGLPNVTLSGTMAQVGYLIRTQIQAVNKTQGAANAAGVYSQVGLNLASFDMDSSIRNSVEIGSNLNFPGGFLLAYDGYAATENGFFLWPDSVEVTTSGTGGLITAQQYFYIATYEWADNQGNIFRSAPSIPVSITTTGATSTNTINVPTLRLTYKTSNPAKIVLYRWSAAQQTYYQVTSIANPVLNDLSVDYVTITDTLADSAIIGNNILYTTGGVLENISAPPAKVMTLFNNRLFMIDAEDQNLLWFSKQVIENTPVEMSDLLTLYVAPSVSASGSTGPLQALAPLDDKLILFKSNAIYYINGTGPDNTGANSQYSDPVFITSTVGSANQQSIVFMPNGLMFQSDKGIWLLGRDLSTTYIGAPVQEFTLTATVLSAVNVPGTNQVRFTLDSGITLMYDYYYGQWGTFTNVPAISSTLYKTLHTYIDSGGRVFQETPGVYLDYTNPVLMSFTTSWLNMAGVQGYERVYYFYMLGTYISPHKLQVQLAYDYNSSPTQSLMITPDNYSQNWGSSTLWGSTPTWGGQSTIEQWRVFPQVQKCQSFQITIHEFYDPSYGAPAGAGLTMSGLDVVIGAKSGYPRIKTSRSVG